MRALQYCQDDKLEAGLKRARRPRVTAEPVEVVGSGASHGITGALKSLFGGNQPKMQPVPSSQNVGIPHGVHNLRMRARSFQVYNNGRAVAFCRTYGYEALEPATAGDNEPYPVETEVFASCAMPKDGFYDAIFRISLNGTKRVVIEKFEPCQT